ncbi:MAG: type I-F CRISPR-associated protein Csy1 [Dechloromonas sp.]|nr:MAG: type I-F CRISPR-associated protein Csy1 [Dechloromonas sp.]
MTEPSNSLAPPASVASIKAVINAFLQERLQLKLEEIKPENDVKRQKLLLDYLPENWIANAAKNIWQLELATHVLKYTHPDAKSEVRVFSTNIASSGNSVLGDGVVGSHTVDTLACLDVAGNAAWLPVDKFLSLEVSGLSILDRVRRNDPLLRETFADLGDIGCEWMNAFSNYANPEKKPASHKLAKQVYWPLEGRNYHLLAPLFPTSLVHNLWKRIREDRFSDEAKAARDARRSGLAHPHGYCEYPNVAIQNFGGTKPQNISQLNSERYGENYLLPSLPPNWKSAEVRVPLAVNSVFDRIFGSRPRVRELVRILKEFLVSVEHAGTNIRIRDKRAELAGLIRDEALQYAAELQQLAPGWSASPECLLNSAEQCWLDPERAEQDADFASLRQRGDWQDEICRRFGNWLNARLTTPNTPMGAVEAAHWRDVLDEEMRLMRDEVADDE